MPAQRECDVFANRQRIEKCSMLKEKTDAFTYAGQSAAVETGNLLVVDHDAARVRAEQPDDVFQSDALSCPASAEQAESARPRNLKRHIVEHAVVAERLGDVLETNSSIGQYAGH